MEPIYLYIFVLTCIAGRLVLDTTIKKRKANLLLLEIIQMDREAKDLIREAKILKYEITEEGKINQAVDKVKTYRRISQHIFQICADIERLEAVFRSEIEKLPISIFKEFKIKLLYAQMSRTSKNDVRFNYNSFINDLSMFIAIKYNKLDRPMIELAYEFSKYVESIQCHDGTFIHRKQLGEVLDKWDLNEKLQIKLPPKKKTKVVKI